MGRKISDIQTVDEKNLIAKILDYIKINDFNLGCYDITCPEIGLKREWYVTRTIIPELLPMCIPNYVITIILGFRKLEDVNLYYHIRYHRQ